ncbi:MAG: Transcriptional activator spt7 [Geoglossum umbratile]|nr:MAG: Transcriptional activator spt7 [Geoglossum umbratile]
MSEATSGAEQGNLHAEGELGVEEDARVAAFRDMFVRSEARIAALFKGDEAGQGAGNAAPAKEHGVPQDVTGATEATSGGAAPKKPARAIDEDDYDDYDDEEDEAASGPVVVKKNFKASAGAINNLSPARPASISKLSSASTKPASPPDQSKTSEEMRKKLEEDKKAAEEAAKRSFNTMFYTLENDRDAMLEQQKLEESDRQVDAEIGNGPNANNANVTSAVNGQQGKLSNANLGASSLTLKHLIARIDAKREKVRASDMELRNLMSEVRKNRSKWADEEKVGQEELYEAADKVLSELKAHTEHSTAFLSRVNKREAPDYYNVIKNPMDLGTMTKKLKQHAYKSKKEFVDDLNLIWANCLKYNAEPSHFLRKHALAMRKETEKLVPLIPDIVIKSRAEIEAEERRMQAGDAEGDIDGGEESDDEPIMSSRGRKAPGKQAKKGASKSRTAKQSIVEGTPSADPKPPLHSLGSSGSTNLKNEALRADSNPPFEGSQNGLSTPPPGGTGTFTPGMNGIPGSDTMDVDFSTTLGLGFGIPGSQEDIEYEDLEYRTWKTVTKKDRALVAAERHRLFKGDRLNGDEPALLRTKVGMRRWMRRQRQAVAEGVAGENKNAGEQEDGEGAGQGAETLAEGMEGEEDRVLPDYYDPLSAIPELPERLRWIEDAEGNVVEGSAEYLRVVEKGHFLSPQSALTRKIEANMRQMQGTRKICSKIGVIKQMQLQSQMYTNQFQKYNPEPFVEADIPPHVVSDDGPIMSPWVCRAALQRSVGKIMYHAGFEEYQPSALDAITDIAADFFTKLVRTLGVYHEVPKVADPAASGVNGAEKKWKPVFTTEEIILHCLHENGLDVESLENYVNDDVDRLGIKLGVMHERMTAHLKDLLRPALSDGGADGSNAFNDGSEQFVGGDFADEINEDFFGFKELGLDKEFGLSSFTVPLHLLQSRMHNHYQAQNTSNIPTLLSCFPTPPLFEPLMRQNIKNQVGLVQNFFLAKIHAQKDNEPLIEDEDLPQKQRFPKPRLPPTGKITSPRKRPAKEQGGGAKKKKKVENTAAAGSGKGGGGDADKENSKEGVKEGKMAARLKLSLPPPISDAGKVSEPEKDDASGVGMMSPESIAA